MSLGVSANNIETTCVYRISDATKLDLLTLERSCEASRMLKDLVVNFLQERRLQGEGFGVEIEVLGEDAVQATNDAKGNDQPITELLASKIASTELVIESDLLPDGVTVEAGIGDISVSAAMPPTAAPIPGQTSSTEAPEAEGSGSDGQEPNAEKVTEDISRPGANENAAPEATATRIPLSSMPSRSPRSVLIAVCSLVASSAVLVLGTTRLWRGVKKAWRPLEIEHKGNMTSGSCIVATEVQQNVVHVTISDVGPEGVKITIAHPDAPTETEESSFF
jgi:hypothetical protein